MSQNLDDRAALTALTDQFQAASRDAMARHLRVYEPEECGGDGYPFAWHAGIKDLIRELADHRCVRCGHPYRKGEHGRGEWTPCDERCSHDGPLRLVADSDGEELAVSRSIVEKLADRLPGFETAGELAATGDRVLARWRILTVHHLTGVKADLRWWNLAALCQRCHLQIQGRVNLAQVYPHDHSEWFKPYAAGYYAATYLGEALSREQTLARLDELLALESTPLLNTESSP